MSILKSKLSPFILLWILGLSPLYRSLLWSQEDAAKEKHLYVNFDYSCFRNSENLDYIEYYFGISRENLTYTPDNGRFKSTFIVDVKLYQKDSLFTHKAWSSVNYVDSLVEIKPGHQLFTVGTFVLPPGQYDAVVTISEAESKHETRIKHVLEVLPFKKDSLEISEIQLASSVTADTSQSIFTKNGLRVHPNPSGIFGMHMPMLYFYSEIYNLQIPSEGAGQYSISYRIVNGEGQEVKSFPAKIKNKPGKSVVEIGGINIISLKSGTYFIELKAVDLTTNQIETEQKKFYVYREQDTAALEAEASSTVGSGKGFAGVDADLYNTATESEIDEEFETTRYINAKEDRNTYKNLNLDGKRSFIRDFWSKMDPSPGTVENERKKDYLESVRYANENFSGTFKKGWKTDRGRILLVYGKPDEIERFPFSTENRSYQIWHYFSIQGGVYFIFVDKRGMGEYELVHATARGELYDADWQRWINPNN